MEKQVGTHIPPHETSAVYFCGMRPSDHPWIPISKQKSHQILPIYRVVDHERLRRVDRSISVHEREPACSAELRVRVRQSTFRNSRCQKHTISMATKWSNRGSKNEVKKSQTNPREIEKSNSTSTSAQSYEKSESQKLVAMFRTQRN